MRLLNCNTVDGYTACQCSLQKCSSFSLKSFPSSSISSLLNPGMSTLPYNAFSTLVASATGRLCSIKKAECWPNDLSMKHLVKTNSLLIEDYALRSVFSLASSSRRSRLVSVAASNLPGRSVVGVNRDSAESSRKCQQRSYGRPRILQATSDASVPLGANIEFSEPNTFAHPPAFNFLTSERMKVVVMLAFALALCNADRVVMSVAIVRLSSMFNWSTSFAGIVQSSFLWGYVISPIIGGALVDQYGGKTLMAYGVGFWSLATFLTPWAANHSVGMLFVVRVLMGLAEGVAMPSMNNMVSRWFPGSERATAVGLCMAGFHLGSVAGFLVTPVIMSRFGVYMPFFAFGLIGSVWLLLWGPLVSEETQYHPTMGRAGLQYIQQEDRASTKKKFGSSENGTRTWPPFSLLFGKLPTWALIVANFMNNWGYFVLLSWMPIYFTKVFGVNLKQAAWFSAAPWAMMAGIGLIAGTSSDRLIIAGLGVTSVRKIMQTIGFLGPALALLGVNASPSASIAVIWLTVGVGLSAFSQAGFLVNFQEIAPRYAGVIHGISNTAGTVAAIISTIGTGYFIQWLGSFQAFLNLTAILYILSAIFFILFATGQRVFD